jgi:hypothetical protein
VPTSEFRLAYHQPQAGARLIPFAAMAPIPVYVEDVSFLSCGDFSQASLLQSNGQDIVRAVLTPEGRTKLNYVGARNKNARSIQDYVGLLLYVDGEQSNNLTMIFEPLPGDELEIRSLRSDVAAILVSSINHRVA